MEQTFNWKRLLITVFIVLFTAGVVGGTTWYVMDAQSKKDKTETDRQINALEKQVSELKTPTKAATVAAAVTTATTSKTGSDAAKEFCLADARKESANSSVYSFVYAETENGQFINCAISLNPTGYVLIAKKVNNVWTKVFAGQEAISRQIADQYKIPSNISGLSE